MNLLSKKISLLFLRYIILVIGGLGNLWIFYKLMTPITVYTSFFLLNLISHSQLIGQIIIFKNIAIELIPACIAGSAYYLLVILNLSTPFDNFKTRIKALIFSCFILFILNILRITLLAIIYSPAFFNSVHFIMWQVLSTIFVVAIWIFSVFLFRIRNIPFYSDIRYLSKIVKKSSK